MQGSYKIKDGGYTQDGQKTNDRQTAHKHQIVRGEKTDG